MKIFFAILSIFFCQILSAQLSQFTKFRHISTENGLPQNSSTCFIQDKDGFIWISTGDGLCKYDGFSFQIFRNDEKDSNSISSNTVECMVSDDDGNIWLGHAKEGISRMDRISGKCTNFSMAKDSLGLWSDWIRAIAKTDDGKIWIGTSGGLNYYDPEDKKIKRVLLSDPNGSGYNPDGNAVWALFADGNNIWVGTYRGGGLFRLESRTLKKRHFKNDPENSNSLISDYVVGITKDKSGLIWLATRNGLCSYDEKSETFIGYRNDPNDPNSISSNDLWAGMIVDSKNNLWVGTLTDGLNLFHRETQTFTRFKHNPNYKYSLSYNSILDIFEDRSGLIWIGTGNGINIYSPYQQSFSSIQSIPGDENSLAGDQILFIEKDNKGRIWLGIGSEGIDIYDPSTGKIRHLRSDSKNPRSLPSNAVRDIAFDENGVAYIVMHAIPSVCTYDYDSENIRSIGGFWGKTIHADRKGKIWVGTTTGLGTLDSFDIYNQNSAGEKRMVNHNIVFISDAEEDHLWVVAANSLAKFDTRKRTFKYFENKYNLFCIFYDSKNRLWGGSSSGLIRYDPVTMKIMERYGVPDGFPNELISSINEDAKGKLWLGSNLGLICFDPETKEVNSYDSQDGLPNNEFNMGSIRYKDDFYISTVSGVLIFNPSKILRNEHRPPIAITRLSVLNKPYQMSKEETESRMLTFTHEQYFFTVEFAALDFVQPEKNQYAYKLVGFNDDWVYIGNKHEVTFTNLNPGEYKLLIKASNSHGVWNEEGFELTIVILPPWWKTTWFRVTAIFGILLIIFGIFTWRTANLKKQKRILENTVKERTSEVVRQKEIIEEKQKEIIDSINYAKRLQEAILTPKEEIDRHLKENFLLYVPKDIVAGDFYFFEVTETHIYYAAADCTGHGVPGAMVSIVCSNALTRCVYEFNLTDPGKILDKARELILDTFKKSSGRVQDGMDISLLVVERKTGKKFWAGANNPLWIIKDEQLIEVKADKQPIGITYDPQPFITHELNSDKGDFIFLFTDGYADQFGGPKGKKFKYSKSTEITFGECQFKTGID